MKTKRKNPHPALRQGCSYVEDADRDQRVDSVEILKAVSR